MAHSIQNKLYNGFQSLKTEANTAVGFLGNHKVASVVTGIGVGAAFTTGCLLFGKGIPLAVTTFITATSGCSYFFSMDNKMLPKQIFQHATNDKECFVAGFKQGVKQAGNSCLMTAATMAIWAGYKIWA